MSSVKGRRKNSRQWSITEADHAFNTCNSCPPEDGTSVSEGWENECKRNIGNEDDCGMRPWSVGAGTGSPPIWRERMGGFSDPHQLNECLMWNGMHNYGSICNDEYYGLYPRLGDYSQEILWTENWNKFGDHWYGDDEPRKYRFTKDAFVDDCNILGAPSDHDGGNKFVFGGDFTGEGVVRYPYPDTYPQKAVDAWHSNYISADGERLDAAAGQGGPVGIDDIGHSRYLGELDGEVDSSIQTVADWRDAMNDAPLWGEEGQQLLARPADAVVRQGKHQQGWGAHHSCGNPHNQDNQVATENDNEVYNFGVQLNHGEPIPPASCSFQCNYNIEDFNLPAPKYCRGNRIDDGATCNSASTQPSCEGDSGRYGRGDALNDMYQCTWANNSCNLDTSNVCLFGETTNDVRTNTCIAKPKSRSCVGNDDQSDASCRTITLGEVEDIVSDTERCARSNCTYIPNNYRLENDPLIKELNLDPSDLCGANSEGGECEKKSDVDQDLKFKYNCFEVPNPRGDGSNPLAPHDDADIRKVVERIKTWRERFYPPSPTLPTASQGYLQSCNYAKIMEKFCQNIDFTNDGKLRSFYNSDNDNLKASSYSSNQNICKEWKTYVQQGKGKYHAPNDLEWCTNDNGRPLSEHRTTLDNYRDKTYMFYMNLEDSVKGYCNSIVGGGSGEDYYMQTKGLEIIGQDDIDPICHCYKAENIIEYKRERDSGAHPPEKVCWWQVSGGGSCIPSSIDNTKNFIPHADLESTTRPETCPDNYCVAGVFMNDIAAEGPGGSVNIQANPEISVNCPGNCQRSTPVTGACEWKIKDGTKWSYDVTGGEHQRCTSHDGGNPCVSKEPTTYTCRTATELPDTSHCIEENQDTGRGDDDLNQQSGIASVFLEIFDDDGGEGWFDELLIMIGFDRSN